MPAKRVAAGLVLVLVGISVGRLFNEGNNGSSHEGTDLAPSNISSASNSLGMDGASRKHGGRYLAATPQFTPLRPVEVAPGAGQIARSFNERMSLARQGDTGAACALALDLNRCRNREKSLAAATRIRDAMAQGRTSSDEHAVSTVATILNSAAALDEACSGVTPEMMDQAYDLQIVAANRDFEQARWLAMNPYLEREDVLKNLERWSDYQRFAKRYFADAATRKDSQDLVGLLLVHYPGETSLPRPPYAQPDPGRFLALLSAAESASISVPADIQEYGDKLRKENVHPEPISLGRGWTGKAPQSIDVAVRDSMFPMESNRFCLGSK